MIVEIQAVTMIIKFLTKPAKMLEHTQHDLEGLLAQGDHDNYIRNSKNLDREMIKHMMMTVLPVMIIMTVTT